jgi:hypothetical protein
MRLQQQVSANRIRRSKRIHSPFNTQRLFGDTKRSAAERFWEPCRSDT